MTSTPKLDLGDDQRFALMKLRRNVSDCKLPENDDFYLLKWLRARNFNVELTEKMLREHLRWRERVDADHYLTHWSPPKALAQYFPSGVCGVDKDHVPVVVFPFSGFDIWGMMHASSKSDFIKMTARTMDKHLQEGVRISKELGRPSSAPQIFVIMEMSGFELRRYTSRLVIEGLLSWVTMFEANFPEVLKKCLFINSPGVFSVLFAIVRPFLHENTLKKVQFFGANNPQKWLAYILQYVDIDQLPVYIGGTKTGPNGDPTCSDKIAMGGRVPKSMYLKNQSKSEDVEVWSTASLKKKEKLNLNFAISPQQAGSYLKWEFYMDKSADVKFAVYRGDDVILEPRVISSSCKSAPEHGLHLCEQPGTYIVEFENVSLHSNKLHYQVCITAPFKPIKTEHQVNLEDKTNSEII